MSKVKRLNINLAGRNCQKVLRVQSWSDPVFSGEAVQLHLTAADSVCEVSERFALHLLPVHVKILTPADKRHQRHDWDKHPVGGACFLTYLKNPVADKLTFSEYASLI